ncbi:MAG: hypothetical protein V3R57_05835 [Candidatus Bathyarchaeia archaeon]
MSSYSEESINYEWLGFLDTLRFISLRKYCIPMLTAGLHFFSFKVDFMIDGKMANIYF